MKKLLLMIVVVFGVLQGTANAADWKGSFNASYQAAQPGDTITVPAGTIQGNQIIEYRSGVANLSNPCTTANTTKCIHFVMAGPVTVNGIIEVRGSSVWIDGGPNKQLRATGYISVETGGITTNHPDHIIVEGFKTVSFGAFNVDTMTFRNGDVGPCTAFWTGRSPAACREGSGFESKIGFGGGNTFVPKDVTLDGMFIHDQNGDSSRLQNGADVHFGGLFIVTVDGLTVKNSVFQANVVYHVQIQNFSGPPAKRVVFDNNSFSCPVDWLYVTPLRCDAQDAIQFDYDPAGQFTLTNNIAANGTGGLYGCYVGSCGGLSSLIVSGNVEIQNSTTAPPLLNGGNPPPPPACSNGKDDDGDGKIDGADSGCSGPGDTDEKDPTPPPMCQPPAGTTLLSVVKTAETSSTITLGWSAVSGAVGFRFGTAVQGASPTKFSHTWDGQRVSVKFSKAPAGQCYWIEPLKSGGLGGFPSLQVSHNR